MRPTLGLVMQPRCGRGQGNWQSAIRIVAALRFDGARGPCDIFALGALLHALVSGHPPTGTTGFASLAFDNESLNAICGRCLAADSRLRFPGAQELVCQLRKLA